MFEDFTALVQMLAEKVEEYKAVVVLEERSVDKFITVLLYLSATDWMFHLSTRNFVEKLKIHVSMSLLQRKNNKSFCIVTYDILCLHG